MKGIKRLVGGVFGAQIVSAVMQAVSLTALARATSPHVFGLAGAIIAVLTVLMSISDIGLGAVASRAAARDASSPELATALKSALNSSIATAAALAMAMVVMAGTISGILNFLPLVVWTIFEKRLSMRSLVAIATGCVKASTFAIIASRLTGVVSLLALLHWSDCPPTLAYSLSFTLGSGFGLLVITKMAPRVTQSSTGSAPTGSVIRQGFPYWSATISYQIRTLDVTLVSLVASPAVAGIYAVPARLSAPLRLFPVAVNSLMLPVVASGDRALLKQLLRLVNISWLTVFMALSGIFIFSRPLIEFTLGREYLAAAGPLRILCLGIALNIIGSSRSALLQASGDQHFVARLGIALSFAMLLSVGAGTLFWGAEGAALGMTTVYLIQLAAVRMRRVPELITHG